MFGVEPGLVLLRESFWNEMIRSNQLFLICISSYEPMSFCGLLELARRAISEIVQMSIPFSIALCVLRSRSVEKRKTGTIISPIKKRNRECVSI